MSRRDMEEYLKSEYARNVKAVRRTQRMLRTLRKKRDRIKRLIDYLYDVEVLTNE